MESPFIAARFAEQAMTRPHSTTLVREVELLVERHGTITGLQESWKASERTKKQFKIVSTLATARLRLRDAAICGCSHAVCGVLPVQWARSSATSTVRTGWASLRAEDAKDVISLVSGGLDDKVKVAAMCRSGGADGGEEEENAGLTQRGKTVTLTRAAI